MGLLMVVKRGHFYCVNGMIGPPKGGSLHLCAYSSHGAFHALINKVSNRAVYKEPPIETNKLLELDLLNKDVPYISYITFPMPRFLA